MKIALVTPYYFPTIGGYSTFAHNLGNALILLGHDVDIITSSQDGKAMQSPSDKLNVICFPRRGIPLRKKFSLLRNIDLRNLCLIYTNEYFFSEVGRYFLENTYDVIHTNGFPFEALPSTFQNKSISVHTFHTESVKPAKLPSRLIYRRLFTFIDHATCVSQHLAQDVSIKLGLSVPNIINNGVDLDFFKPASKDEADKGIVIGSVTNFSWKRKACGLKMLIDSVKTLKAEELRPEISKLIIVGKGKFRNEIMDYAAKVGLKDVIFRTGTYQEMPSIYNEFDIYVHASGQEGFPISVLEALACGKPVVTNSNILELVSLRAVHFVESQGDMIHALRKLITDVERRREEGIPARKEASNFSWLNIAKAYLSVYNKGRTSTNPHRSDNS